MFGFQFICLLSGSKQGITLFVLAFICLMGKKEYFAYLWGSQYLLEPSLICILSNHMTLKYHLSQPCQLSPEINISSVE